MCFKNKYNSCPICMELKKKNVNYIQYRNFIYILCNYAKNIYVYNVLFVDKYGNKVILQK